MAGHQPIQLALPVFREETRILIAVAPYYHDITGMLLAGAVRMLENAGAIHERVDVPGALEIPPAIKLASGSRRFDGFVALGCVIRGETTHYDTVCNESARGLMSLGLEGLCIGNGILTVESRKQAELRADPAKQDNGGGAAAAALHLVAARRRFEHCPDGNAG